MNITPPAETILLRIEPKSGWLHALLHIIDHRGFRPERFVLSRTDGPGARRSSELHVRFTVRGTKPTASLRDLVSHLRQLPDVCTCRRKSRRQAHAAAAQESHAGFSPVPLIPELRAPIKAPFA